MRHLETVERARELRKSGWSIRKIAKELAVRSSFVSRWCEDGTQASTNKSYLHYYNLRQKYLNQDEITLNIDNENAKFVASMLYWCEGSKYPSTGLVTFTSSDVDMVRLFVNLLRRGFDLNESKFRVKLQLHSDQNVEELSIYWSNQLAIPTIRFIKPTITNKTKSRYRNNYLGTCSLRYGDYSVLLRLMGIYKRFAVVTIPSLLKINMEEVAI